MSEIEATTTEEKPAIPVEDAPVAKPEENLISIDKFFETKLKVGQILEAEKVEKSNKLVKLQVHVGEETPRQILAGIGRHYTPEELIGRKIIVVANLKPAKLMGHESQGMLLAASDDNGNLELLSVAPTIPAGTSVG